MEDNTALYMLPLIKHRRPFSESSQHKRHLADSYSPLLRNPRPWTPERGSHCRSMCIAAQVPLLSTRPSIVHIPFGAEVQAGKGNGKDGNKKALQTRGSSLLNNELKSKLCNCSTAICWKVSPHSIVLPWPHLSNNNSPCVCGSLPGFSILFHWLVSLSFPDVTLFVFNFYCYWVGWISHYFDHCSFIVGVKIR